MLTNILRVGAASIGLLTLAGCGSADEPPQPPPVEETVFKDVAVTPVEKARDVQNIVDEQKRAADQALQQQEQ
jgi:hypothetical protein